MKILINKLSLEYVSEVAYLHQRFLPTSFRGFPGQKMLELYYKNLGAGLGGQGYIALDEGKFAGYICGIWDSYILHKQLLKKQWTGLGFWGGLCLLTSPRLVTTLAKRLFLNQISEFNEFSGYELRPIVVAPEFRGGNIGLLLVDQLMMDAQSRGFNSIYLLAEENNKTAVRFYEKAGFNMQGSLIQSKKNYLIFIKSVQEKNEA